MNHMDRNHYQPSQAELARWREAYELREQRDERGRRLTFRAIAARLGVSAPMVRVRIQKHLKWQAILTHKARQL